MTDERRLRLVAREEAQIFEGPDPGSHQWYRDQERKGLSPSSPIPSYLRKDEPQAPTHINLPPEELARRVGQFLGTPEEREQRRIDKDVRERHQRSRIRARR